MALVTEHLGFGITAGTAYEHPYPFARRLSTLDHLTNGRVGWNVVTGYLPSAARNMGNEDQLEHDERYNHADEYLEVLYKLLEGSWEDDAVIRDRYSVRIYTMLTVITDETEEKAQAKHADYQQCVSYEGALVLLSGWLGIDLSVYDPDEPIGNVESNAIQSAVANFQKVNDDGAPWTVRDIAAWAGIGGLGPRVVGSGAQVADELQAWVEETDVDGFNLAYAITPGSFEDVIAHVVPELQKRGAYPTEYVDGTLRHKLFGKGGRLPEEHRGARYRLQSARRGEEACARG